MNRLIQDDTAPPERRSERRWRIERDHYEPHCAALDGAWGAAERVDARAWSDLEMDLVFERFDRSATPCGSQWLRWRMSRYASADEAAQTASDIDTLARDKPLAERLKRALEGLNCKEAAELPAFLFRTWPEAPRFAWIIYALSTLTLALTAAVFFVHALLIPLAGLWIVNMILANRHGQTFAADAPALAALSRLLGVARKLRDLPESGLPDLAALSRLSTESERVRKRIGWMAVHPVNTGDLVAAVYEYLNMCCLFERACALRSTAAIRGERESLARVFLAVARLDACRGLAETLEAYPARCRAELSPARGLEFDDLYHPLVDGAVPNSIATTGSLLVSGSNMAGKTTFIKSAAINLILGQTLGLCLARAARFEPLSVSALIRRDDTVSANQSYFFAEAKALLALMEEAGREDRRKFLVVDEIFRGTNTRERIAAGNAVLSHLSRRMLVIATTHDTELSAQLEGQFRSVHFAERVGENGIEFDYRIKTGPCLTRNAIRLLSLAGYPPEVISTAEAALRFDPAG